MKVYRIKQTEHEEVDCGLLGPSWETNERYLDEVYATKEVAEKHIPPKIEGIYYTSEYSIVEQEIIND